MTAEGRVLFGGNNGRNGVTQLHGPTGLSFGRHGHLYVTDLNNHMFIAGKFA